MKNVRTVGIAIISALIGFLMLNAEMAKSESGYTLPIYLLITVIPTSVFYWYATGRLIIKYKLSLLTAIFIGLVSPFIGAAIVGLPPLLFFSVTGVYIAWVYYYVTIPVGIIAGVLVWLEANGYTAKENAA